MKTVNGTVTKSNTAAPRFKGSQDFDDDSCSQASLQLSAMSAEERIRWAVDNFGDNAILLSSMQKTSSVLMHMLHRMGLGNEILFIDTGYHFQETLRLRDEFIRRYGLNVVSLYPEQSVEQQEKEAGYKLYEQAEGQKLCCKKRKIIPFLSYMKYAGHKLAMVGVRSNEGYKRSAVDYLIKDSRTEGYTIHPILDWTDNDIEKYLNSNDVPVHILHSQSYPSIGCECCTTPVYPGEDARAGRWRHLRKPDDAPKYCEILLTDGAGI